MVTFVQATFVLATFVHISNVSAFTDLLLTKLFWPNFFGALFLLYQHFVWPTKPCATNFLDPKIYMYLNFFGPEILRTNLFVDPKFFEPNIFEDQKIFNPKFLGWQKFWTFFLDQIVVRLKRFLNLIFFGSDKFFSHEIFPWPKFFWDLNSFDLWLALISVYYRPPTNQISLKWQICHRG